MPKNIEDQLNDEQKKNLLSDRTTGKNIIWATDYYSEFGYDARDEIKINQVGVIRPRYEKNRELKKLRTRQKGEIFTPQNICTQQNNLIDANHFDWQAYVKYTVLEITCGEAPYIVSRYNTVTGEKIPIENRDGILDRKLRVISENCNEKENWELWAKKAVQNVYGYELQGDNLFLARKNIFLTYIDYYKKIFYVNPAFDILKEIAEIISWNFWQMDGLTNAVPYFGIENQSGLFDPKVYCKIKDWKNYIEIEFRNCG